MSRPITSEIVETYVQCPRKAFLLLQGGQEAVAHEYQQIIDKQEAANREAHNSRMASEAGGGPARGPEGLAHGPKVLLDVVLAADGLEARFDALRKVRADSAFGGFGYEPVKVVGTMRVARDQAVGLAYLGHVLGLVQRQLPAAGTLVLAGGRACRVKLAARYKEVRSVVAALQAWMGEPAPKPPPVVLNKHCPSCPFRAGCRRQAEEQDSLSLLDRMTPKQMRKYHDKGIFTVRQLSHIYKPRRSRKKAMRQVRHSLELQALAIRTGKTYVEHLPELSRRPVELFVDMEGIPDKDAYYLAGLLVCRDGGAEYESFWADDATGEYGMWTALADRLEAFPEAPIYHYGSYEKKAFATLAKQHGRSGGLRDRLVNVASSVYGKGYFPVRSNGLKPLGRYLGAAWSDPQASGLQSLVWRHRWEMTRDERHKQALLQYNREDCEAVRLLVDRLDRIRRAADSDPEVEFARRPKRIATETGTAVHGQFQRILQSAQAAFTGRGIRIREVGTEEADAPKKKGGRKGHQHFRRIVPKASRIVFVEPRQQCPNHDVDLVPNPKKPAEKTVIDLVFTKIGCRKAVTKYVGIKGRCPKCGEHYNPAAFRGPHSHAFGHGLQAWTIYQRVVLRLPYEIIAQVMDHLFGIGVCTSTLVGFVGNLAGYYAPTETAILQATGLLQR